MEGMFNLYRPNWCLLRLALVMLIVVGCKSQNDDPVYKKIVRQEVQGLTSIEMSPDRTKILALCDGVLVEFSEALDETSRIDLRGGAPFPGGTLRVGPKKSIVLRTSDGALLEVEGKRFRRIELAGIDTVADSPFAIDSVTGETYWINVTGNAVSKSRVVAKDAAGVYAAAGGDVFYATDKEIVWHKVVPQGSLSVPADRGNNLCFDPDQRRLAFGEAAKLEGEQILKVVDRGGNQIGSWDLDGAIWSIDSFRGRVAVVVWGGGPFSSTYRVGLAEVGKSQIKWIVTSKEPMFVRLTSSANICLGTATRLEVIGL